MGPVRRMGVQVPSCQRLARPWLPSSRFPPWKFKRAGRHRATLWRDISALTRIGVRRREQRCQRIGTVNPQLNVEHNQLVPPFPLKEPQADVAETLRRLATVIIRKAMVGVLQDVELNVELVEVGTLFLLYAPRHYRLLALILGRDDAVLLQPAGKGRRDRDVTKFRPKLAKGLDGAIGPQVAASRAKHAETAATVLSGQVQAVGGVGVDCYQRCDDLGDCGDPSIQAFDGRQPRGLYAMETVKDEGTLLAHLTEENRLEALSPLHLAGVVADSGVGNFLARLETWVALDGVGVNFARLPFDLADD